MPDFGVLGKNMIARIGYVIAIMIFSGWTFNDPGWEPISGIVFSWFGLIRREIEEKEHNERKEKKILNLVEENKNLLNKNHFLESEFKALRKEKFDEMEKILDSMKRKTIDPEIIQNVKDIAERYNQNKTG